MQLNDIFQDKTLKQKTKVEMISDLVMDKKMNLDELINFAGKTREIEKATCIESIEFATKKQATIATEKCLKFITKSLTDNAPRVKWESAKVIGNIASLFSTNKLKPVIKELLVNSENKGTVVRWATAYALGEIVKLKTDLNKELIPAIESICAREGDTGVKKKYLEALKKAKK
ncbi:MAG: HEAT repeat domain-containing protein [Chitinophagaceae bacterium]